MKTAMLLVILTIWQTAPAVSFNELYKNEFNRSLTEIKCNPIIDSDNVNTYYCDFVSTRYIKNLSGFTEVVGVSLAADPKHVLKQRRKILTDPDPELIKLLASKNIDPNLDLAIHLITDFIHNPDDRKALDSYKKLLDIKDKYCYCS